MTPPPSARSSGVVVAIRSAVVACQHAVGQDVVGRDERGEVGDAQPPWPCHAPGSAAGGCRPRRCRPTRTSTSTRSRPSRPVAPARRRHETVGVQHQQLRRVDLLHHETRRRRVGRRGCHHLPPAAVEGREPAGWRWASLAEQQPVDPPGGVETAAVPAHLTLGEFAVGPGNLRSRGNLVRHRVVAGSAPRPMAAVKSRSVRMPTRCWPRRPERCRPGASSCGRPPRPGPPSPGR